MDKLREADAIVDSLGKAMQSGETGLRYVPALLVRVINEGMWQDRVITKTGQPAHFDHFIDFVTTAPLEGLGADIKTLQRLCADNPAALDAIDRVTLHQGERTDLHNNIMKVENAEQGTSAAYALRRLRKDRPDLHARVLAKEISPNAAMVEAGFRKATITIPRDTNAAAAAILRHFTPEQIADLVGRLLART